MARLFVHVEGQTEEDFVNRVLQSYLVEKGFHSVSARLVGNIRQRAQRGGIKSWPSVRKEIANHLRQDPSCVSTTMVDFYALPQSKIGAWPGRAESHFLPHSEKALRVEASLFNDMLEEFNSDLSEKRFIPFVVMHEFEALLFSDCASFSKGIGRPELESRFANIRDQFDTPEHINDSPVTAPSKRIMTLFPGYTKPLHGSLAASAVGLDRIRQQCPHFDQWIKRLLNCLP